MHREHGLSVENNIMGIQLKSTKSRSTEDLGESTRLDFQLEFSEIHVCSVTVYFARACDMIPTFHCFVSC